VIDDHDSLPDAKRRKAPWRTRLAAGVLLTVFLCAIVTTPIVVLVRWSSERDRRAQEQAAPASTLPGPAPQLESTPGGVPETGTMTAHTEPDARVNRIAVITLSQQLVTVNPDGTDERRLTDTRERYQFPAWSPDGSQVAVIGGVSVYVFTDVDNGEPPLVLYQNREESPFYLYWSPDSRTLSFLANHSDGIALHLSLLAVAEPSSRILTTGQPLYWDWTPAGDGILIHTGLTGRNARLALIDPTGEGGEGNIADPGLFQAPGISHSGRYWAYARADDLGNSQLVVHNEEGERRVIEEHLEQVAMTWSPRSEMLAYTSPSADSSSFYGQLRLYDAENGRRQTLSPGTVVAYFWSPDSRRIAYLTLPGEDDGGTQASGALVRTLSSAAAPEGGRPARTPGR
jgi:WD40 repeat protein